MKKQIVHNQEGICVALWRLIVEKSSLAFGS